MFISEADSAEIYHRGKIYILSTFKGANPYNHYHGNSRLDDIPSPAITVAAYNGARSL